jgi:hypothetical protein
MSLGRIVIRVMERFGPEGRRNTTRTAVARFTAW